MALTKEQLAVAVAKYIEYKENGFTPEEIKAEILKDEIKYKPADITKILAGIVALEDSDPGDEEDETPDEQAPAAVTTESKGLNRDYEEWSVDPVREPVYNELGKQTGTQVNGFTKIKKIRTTRITEKVATELNSQSVNTLLHLYPVGGDK